MSPKKLRQSNACAKDVSVGQEIRDHHDINTNSVASSVREISIIETMESFLEENAGTEVDPKVLRILAQTLTKRFQDTSPGTLQDVTMDHSYVAGCRSSNYQGNVSPTSHGRSVREFEEQMAALHKENFNLKLKLFFLEESVPGYKQTQTNGQDPILKQLIEKKVENEMLKKDLQDNQVLLLDGMRTIEELEEMIKIKESEHKAELDQLNHKINFYEMERELQQESSCLFEHGNAKGESKESADAEGEMQDLRQNLSKAEEQIEDFQEQISKLDEILMTRDETIKDLNERINELQSHNDKLKLALEKKANDVKSAETEKLHQMIQDLRIEMADKVCMLDETEDKLKQKTQVYEKALKTIQKLVLTIGSQKREIAKLQDQSKNMTNATTTSPKSTLLQSGLMSGLAEGLEFSSMNKSISDSETCPNPNEALVSDLKKQLEQARSEAENAEKWRKECADVCAVLTNRLEELAGFLNSLLRQKDVLGILAADRRKAMRKAVDRSLDLSKSLNMTLSISGLSINDMSLAHLSNLSEILGYQDNMDDEENTFNSHVDVSRPSIEMTKAEKQQLIKKESSEKRRSLEVKKERKSIPVHLNAEVQSESEAWSEPDRLVSMARIGLDEHSISLSKDQSMKKLESSESEADPLNQSRNNSKTRIQERVAQLEQIINEKDEKILDIQCQLVEADNRLKKENLRVLEMTNRIDSLQQRNDELQEELETLEQQMGSMDFKQNPQELLHEIEVKKRALEDLRMEMEEMKFNHEIALNCANEQLKEKLQKQKEAFEAIQEKNLKEMELKYKNKLDKDYVTLLQFEEIKAQLLELQKQYVEAQNTIEHLTDNEHDLKQSLLDLEMEARTLKKQLDESTLQASRAIMERTKAFNEKLQFEKHIEELKVQIVAFEAERNTLTEQIHKKEEQIEALEAAKMQNVCLDSNGNGEASASGYTSEEVPNAFNEALSKTENKSKLTQRAVKRQNNSSSPDLGIESDAGRLSGTEAKNSIKNLNTININEVLEDHQENVDPQLIKADIGTNTSATSSTTNSNMIRHDCAKVDQENTELRRKLLRTKQAFEDTYEKLRIANQRKAQIEKDIKNQILKTHSVLRNVRTNMENEL